MLQSHTSRSVTAGFHLARLSLGAISAALFFIADNMPLHYRDVCALCQASQFGKITLPYDPLYILIAVKVVRQFHKHLILITD